MTDSSTTLPVPEPKWKFRRMAVFGTMIASSALIAFIVLTLGRAQAVNALQTIALVLLAKQMFVLTIYLMAPTAEYLSSVAKLVQAAKS